MQNSHKTVQEEIRKQFPDSLIQYISFELLENRQYRDAPSLYSHLESCLDSEKWNFIFLDEIQFVDGWPEVVNSLKTKYRTVSIFLTGSNSDLLSEDKEQVLGGRTLSFRVTPFTFSEFHDYRKELFPAAPHSPEEDFNEYLQWGGFPLIFAEQDIANREIMLESIFDSIVLRDIVRRLKLKNSYDLERLLDYVISITGNYVSGRKICEHLAGGAAALSLPKVLEYLKAIGTSCLVDIVPRFDLLGLKVLELNNKIYACDTSFVNYRKSLVSDLYGSLYETIVYHELVARGYQVRTGAIHGKEIDFVASKGSDRRYFQISYEINDGNRDREFAPLKMISDNYPKYVISKDKVLLSDQGIIHQNIIDFLLSPM